MCKIAWGLPLCRQSYDETRWEVLAKMLGGPLTQLCFVFLVFVFCEVTQGNGCRLKSSIRIVNIVFNV